MDRDSWCRAFIAAVVLLRPSLKPDRGESRFLAVLAGEKFADNGERDPAEVAREWHQRTRAD